MTTMHHVGKINNTDRRCVVVYPQNPHNPSLALVVDTDALPDRLHDALINVVEHEGQTKPVLADVLQRRIFTDTGTDLMTTLFQNNALQSQPIDNITLFPKPNNPVPLSAVVNNSFHKSADDMSIQPPTAYEPEIPREILEEAQQPVEAPKPAQSEHFNPYQNNMRAHTVEEKAAVAQNMLIDARELELQAQTLLNMANQKKSHAYVLAPHLKPAEAPKAAPAAPDAPAQPQAETVVETPKPAPKKTASRAKKTPAKKAD